MAELIAFISNTFVTSILIGYVVVLWFALTLWTAADIFGRTTNWFIRFGAVLLTGVGFIFGFVLYLIVRPQTTLEESKVRDFEEKLLESQAKAFVCPSCSELVREEFMFCPNCGITLKRQCPGCQRALEVVWTQCPFCGVGVGPVVLPKIKEAPALAAGRQRGAFGRLFSSIFASPKEATEIRRPRGRPRKYPKVEGEIVRRPRGRPRKDAVI